ISTDVAFRSRSNFRMLIFARANCVAAFSGRSIDLFDQSGGGGGSPVGDPPLGFKMPEETFKNFDLPILDAVLEFPQKISFAKSEIAFVATVQLPTCARSSDIAVSARCLRSKRSQCVPRYCSH